MDEGAQQHGTITILWTNLFEVWNSLFEQSMKLYLTMDTATEEGQDSERIPGRSCCANSGRQILSAGLFLLIRPP